MIIKISRVKSNEEIRLNEHEDEIDRLNSRPTGWRFSARELRIRPFRYIDDFYIQLLQRRRRPTNFVQELVDYTGSDQAVRDLEASMRSFSADVDSAIEATTAEIANSLPEIERRTEQGLISSLLAMLRSTGLIT